MSEKDKIGIASDPEHPDGTKYPHNCCMLPEVWEYSDGSEQCETCGYRWAEPDGETNE